MRPNLTIRHRARPALHQLDARVLPSFTPLTPFTTGITTPRVAVSADFNLDGKDDLAVYNSSGGTLGGPVVSILLSNGDGQFTQAPQVDPLTFDFPTSLITADFNGDGRADLASGSTPGSTLRVYLSNGDGTFTTPFVNPNDTRGIGAGDFNADGKTDLVAVQRIAGFTGYRVFLGLGNGLFAPPSPLVNTSISNSRILTADINGDGHVDFASLSGAGDIVAYLGNGDGTFGAAITTTVSSARDFALADFNGDSRPDIVTAESDFTAGTEVLSLHANTGGGAFDSGGVPFFTQNSGGIRVVAADFDSDGRPDVVTDGVFREANVLYGNGNGTFTPDAGNPYTYSDSGTDLIVGDFDGDKNPDFATVGFGGPSGGRVFRNESSDFTITTLAVVPTQSIVGTPIALTASVSSKFPNPASPQGSVTFTVDGVIVGTATLVNGVATLSVSGLSVGTHTFVAHYSGEAAVASISNGFRQSQSPIVSAVVSPVPIPPPPPPTSVVRTPEFVVGSDNGPVVNFRDGNGRDVKDIDNFPDNFRDSLPAFFDESAPHLSPGVRPALGDFNGDGVSDVVGGSGPGIVAQVTIVDGVTLRPIFTVQPFDGFRGGVFVAAADFNGDGIADFAVGADAGGEPRVCVFLSGNGTFVCVASFHAFDRGFVGGVRLAAGDVNGDGTPDLIVGAGAGAFPTVAVFDGKSLAYGVDRRLINDFNAYDEGFRGGVFVAAGDVDRDGYADIITGAGLGAPHITAVSGQLLFSGLPINQVLDRPLASFFAGDRTNQGGIRVAAQQLDSDGYCDIVAGAGVGNGSTVWGFSGLSLLKTPTNQPASFFAQDVFPGLYAGVYVG